MHKKNLWLTCLCLIILLQGLLCFDCARNWSPTHDEYWHLPVGILHWQTGEFNQDVLNPPLIRLWDALPSLWLPHHEISITPGSDPARHGDAFLSAYRKDSSTLLIWGRMMNVLLSITVTIILACRASKLLNPTAGIFAAAFWAFNPNIIAHSSLVTTDLGAALAFLIVFEATFRLLHKKTILSAVLLGIALGTAQAIKYTCLILIPLSWLTYLILARYQQKQTASQVEISSPAQCSIKPRFCLCGYKLWLIVFSVLILTINLCYLGEGIATPVKEINLTSHKLSTLVNYLPFLNNIPIPLPLPFIQGIDQQLIVMEGNHPVFFMEWYDKSFPAYYFYCFLFKNPVLYLMLLIVGLYSLFKLKTEFATVKTFMLTGIVWCMVLFLIASFSSMQLGIRYILPVYPLLVLVLCLPLRNWNVWQPSKIVAFSIIFLLSTLFTLHNRPHHLSYMNLFAGGTWQGYQVLEDSNYDWGQDLFSLQQYYHHQKIEHVYLAYFGTYPAEVLDINYELPPDNAPRPGWYAISSNLLTGRQYPLRKPDGSRDSGIQDRYFYLRYFTPVSRTGPSIFIYHLSTEDVQRWQSDMDQLYKNNL